MWKKSVIAIILFFLFTAILGNDVNARFNLSIALYNLQRYEESVEEFEKAVLYNRNLEEAQTALESL